MVKYAFDARSSKIILQGEEGDIFADINNILAMEETSEGTLVYLATGGDTTTITVKDKVADIVAFIKTLADEQMCIKKEEAKAREEELKKLQEAAVKKP